MQSWYPEATKLPLKHPLGDGGPYVDVPWRVVLHTTESKAYRPSTKDYYGHGNAPHLTLHGGKLFQHFPFDRASRALENRIRSLGGETNRARAIQIEITHVARDINGMAERDWNALRTFLRWAENEFSVQPYCPPFGGNGQYGDHNALEMTVDEWMSFNGVCGHQHVPKNKHWDPGAISDWRLRNVLGLHVSEELRMVAPVEPLEVHKESVSLIDIIVSLLRSLINGK